MNMLSAFLWFAVIGGGLGIMLAVASKLLAIKRDPRIEEVNDALPGANCGGCGYPGCAGLAEAIVAGEAKANACTAGGNETAAMVSEIMGVEMVAPVRMRAQVMCSGTTDYAKKKYNYNGAPDCIAAVRLGGGDKTCPNGCIGLGTCASKCMFDAITVVNGVAYVDYDKCTGCGTCVAACPKHIIKLIPYESEHWVGCMSVDKGAVTRKYCDVGCISCRLCQRACEHDAITVDDFVASIDYTKCVDCGKCVAVCPRHIIWSGKAQALHGGIILPERLKKAE